jgi:DNA-binding SARP family transcriptional activator/tetratricopeptide (TPR) repeat protein
MLRQRPATGLAPTLHGCLSAGVAEFRVLGPVEVRAGGRLLDAGTTKQQAVLVALLVDAPGPVSADTLVSRVWDEATPDDARGTLYAYLSRIRRMLAGAPPDGTGPVRLVRRAGGYALDLDPDQVDLHRATRLVERARAGTGDGAALLREALGLWTGEPLAGLGGAWLAGTRERLTQQRIDIAVRWAELELRRRNATTVVDTLRPLAGDHPLHEALAGTLMRALHLGGRTAEALDRYTAIRRRLADDLGVDPGPGLRAVHQEILRGTNEPAPPAVPAQLPPDVHGFSGRHRELDRLDALRADAVVISAVSGTAGVGKTALAVHWAHRIAGRYPDGQLYVNLRGFDPTGAALPPADALRLLLSALEVPPRRIPADIDARTGLYRSLLAGKRMLVLLDNARDAEQVRPLLPGAPGCLTIVTSRNELTSLVATEGAHPLALDLLTADEAHQLLARRLGPARLAAEPDAVDAIVTACAGLPLALAIVAARAATRPAVPLATLADQLRDRALGALGTTDPATDLRAVFSWSYRTLGPDAARLFRLLGLAPGTDIAAPAAANLAGIPVAEAGRLLAELTEGNLLTESVPGRYTFHDLLRAYATELAHAVDHPDDRAAAERRLLDHYLHTACTAALLLNPHRDPIAVDPDQPPVELTDALGWFTVEQPALVAAVQRAVDLGLDRHAWRLAWALADFLERQGHWQDWMDTWHIALAAARRRDDRPSQAHAHHSLASACTRLGRYPDAHGHLNQALDLYTRLGDRTGQAHTHNNLALAYEQQGRPAAALDESERSLALYRAAGHQEGQARALNNIGWCLALLGEHTRALAAGREALALSERIGHRHGQAIALDTLGYVEERLGRYPDAVVSYRRSAELFRDLGDRYQHAATLIKLGDADMATGEPAAARDAWRAALAILTDLDHPDAETVRAKLAD